MDFINTCAAGLEQLVAAEISGWGGTVNVRRRGAILWSGNLEQGYRACLWSRFSSRVILVLKAWEIGDESGLYEGTRALDWDLHLSVDSSFAVDCVLSGKGPVTNSMFGALRVKDAIADQFRESLRQRPSVRARQPDVQIYIYIGGSNVLIGLDLSGIPLHRRGYRRAAGPAPLKESLAAAIVALSGWDGSTTLLDPMCGSGTLLIEAALMHGDSAPGLGRAYFGMFGWKGHRAGLWQALVDEAVERENLAQDRNWPPLLGFDGDETAVEGARKNIVRAGLEDRISVSCRELSRLENQFGKTGHLISNPPYGERLSDKQSVKYLYRYLGSRFQRDFADWRVTMFTAAPDFADHFRIESSSNIKIFNGPLPCRLISGAAKKLPVAGNRDGWQEPTVQGAQGGELSNRIIKNFKQIKTLSAKFKLESFRIYDRDLPQYNVTIDLLGPSILITEFSASSKVDQQTADKRFNHVVHCVRSLFQVGREQVFISRRLHRNKQKSKQQTLEVQEGGGVMVIELPGNDDAGFPVDQLLIRRFIASRIGRGRFLSIFDIGGAATVAAALGGAVLTTTIAGSAADDSLINMNFNRNGMAQTTHRIVRKPIVSWLKENRQIYDLMYMNPRRTVYFKGKPVAIDMVKEQRFIIDTAMKSLAVGGMLIFSAMTPSLRLDPLFKQKYRCRDLSRDMTGALPQKRKQRFQCWQIEHGR